ncbi:MAG: hypothetical protein A2Y14_03925 [Verrucomicrobia bacterium GWF2_51_19]|nr:MAG: hypothetical protein A2Y14_03925 [Verrucomicrobia bacterium GWF2_51_19]
MIDLSVKVQRDIQSRKAMSVEGLDVESSRETHRQLVDILAQKSVGQLNDFIREHPIAILNKTENDFFLDPFVVIDEYIPNIHIDDSPLCVAVQNGDWNSILYLLIKHVDINACGRFGTPLRYAAAVGNVEIMKLLIKEGADVNFLPEFVNGEHTPLFAAVVNKKYDTLEYLLSLPIIDMDGPHGIVDIPQEDGSSVSLDSPLVASVLLRDEKAFERLLRAGFNVNKIDEQLDNSPMELIVDLKLKTFLAYVFNVAKPQTKIEDAIIAWQAIHRSETGYNKGTMGDESDYISLIQYLWTGNFSYHESSYKFAELSEKDSFLFLGDRISIGENGNRYYNKYFANIDTWEIIANTVGLGNERVIQEPIWIKNYHPEKDINEQAFWLKTAYDWKRKKHELPRFLFSLLETNERQEHDVFSVASFFDQLDALLFSFRTYFGVEKFFSLSSQNAFDQLLLRHLSSLTLDKTPLIEKAMLGGHEPLAMLCAKATVTGNTKLSSGQTYIEYAASQGLFYLVEYFLDKGTSVSQASDMLIGSDWGAPNFLIGLIEAKTHPFTPDSVLQQRLSERTRFLYEFETFLTEVKDSNDSAILEQCQAFLNQSKDYFSTRIKPNKDLDSATKTPCEIMIQQKRDEITDRGDKLLVAILSNNINDFKEILSSFTRSIYHYKTFKKLNHVKKIVDVDQDSIDEFYKTLEMHYGIRPIEQEEIGNSLNSLLDSKIELDDENFEKIKELYHRAKMSKCVDREKKDLNLKKIKKI